MCLAFPRSLFAGVTNYTNGNAILSLAMNGDILLAGTEGGIVEWDLKNKTYRKITTLDALPNNKITSIVMDRKKGVWWLGTHRGVCRYNGRKWTSYGIKNGLNSMWINKLYLDDEGIVWAGSARGVNWFDNYVWNSLFENKENDPALVYGMTKDKGGQWWFTDKGKGIFVLRKPFELTRYARINNIPSDFTRRVVTDQTGTLWFGTYRGVISYDGKTWKRYGQAEGLTSLQINEIFIDHTDTPWVGTTHGASRYRDGKWTALDLKPLNHYVTSFAEDKRGNLYIGTKDGIVVWNGKKVTAVLKTDDPVEGVSYTDAVMQKDGALWFSATGGGGIVSFDGKRWHHYGTEDGLADDHVLCLSVDPRDRVWAGTSHGVSTLVSGTWRSITKKDGLTANNIYAIAFEKDRVLFGTNEGLFVRQQNRWKTYTRKDGLPDNTVLSLLVDDDLCYAGTLSGFALLQDGKLTPMEALKGHSVTSILKSADGILYVGTDFGLFKVKNEDIRRLGISDGLFDLRVQDLSFDAQSDLWVATQRGLCKYDGERFTCFTRDDGFSDDHINAVVVDGNGYKWLATAQGITRFDERMQFDSMKYIGLAAKAALTLHDNRFNKDPEERETVTGEIRNLTDNKRLRLNLKETGADTGTFQGEFSFTAAPHTGGEASLAVAEDRTNFLMASVSSRTSEPITTRAFWQNDFVTGNINGDAIISRQDAILADQIISGVAESPMPEQSDYDRNGIIDSKDVEYAKEVSSGKIHPWDRIDNAGPLLRPEIAASVQREHPMFSPKELPWTFKRIKASQGGSLELENLRLEIPPHALDQDTLITITRGERTPSPSDIAIYPVGPGYNFYPAGLTFKKAVKIILGVYPSDLREGGVSDLLSVSLGAWNGKGYDTLPSYPFFRENKIVGFIHGFPDNLLRPDRPAFAKTRTAPIMNYLYPSNYFSLITVREEPPLLVKKGSGSDVVLERTDQRNSDTFRLFVIDGKDQRLLLDVDQVVPSFENLSSNDFIGEGGLGGVVFRPRTPYRIGMIGKDAKGNHASLSTAFHYDPSEPPGVESVRVLPEKVTLPKDSDFRFIGLGIAENGTELPGLDFTWATKSSKARISASGILSVRGEGHGTVKAAYGDLTASADYQVAGKPVLTYILMAPTVQVVRVNEERDYQSMGVDQYGRRMDFEPEWFLESRDGEGAIDPRTGHFKAGKEGIYFVQVRGGHNVSRKVISFIGGCTWCHFKGR